MSSRAIAVGEEPDTIEEVYEPYLIMEGYLKRTAQGRVATELSHKKLGLTPAKGSEQNQPNNRRGTENNAQRSLPLASG